MQFSIVLWYNVPASNSVCLLILVSNPKSILTAQISSFLTYFCYFNLKCTAACKLFQGPDVKIDFKCHFQQRNKVITILKILKDY